MVSLLYGILTKQAYPTTDHGAEGTNCRGSTPYKRKYHPSISGRPFLSQLNLKKLYGPDIWMGFNCLKARTTSRRQFTFYH